MSALPQRSGGGNALLPMVRKEGAAMTCEEACGGKTNFGRTCRAPFIEMTLEDQDFRGKLREMQKTFAVLYADNEPIEYEESAGEKGWGTEEWRCEYCGTIQQKNRCQSCGAPKRVFKPERTADEFTERFLEGRYG